MTPQKEIKESELIYNDEYFQNKKEEAKKDDELAYQLYRNYVGSAKTKEERIRRIREFRCG